MASSKEQKTMDLPKINQFLEIYTQEDKNINRASFLSHFKPFFIQELAEIRDDIDDFQTRLNSELEQINQQINLTSSAEQIESLKNEKENWEFDYESAVESRITSGISKITTKVIDLFEEITFKTFNSRAEDKLSDAISDDLEKYL